MRSHVTFFVSHREKKIKTPKQRNKTFLFFTKKISLEIYGKPWGRPPSPQERKTLGKTTIPLSSPVNP